MTRSYYFPYSEVSYLSKFRHGLSYQFKTSDFFFLDYWMEFKVRPIKVRELPLLNDQGYLYLEMSPSSKQVMKNFDSFHSSSITPGFNHNGFVKALEEQLQTNYLSSSNQIAIASPPMQDSRTKRDILKLKF